MFRPLIALVVLFGISGLSLAWSVPGPIADIVTPHDTIVVVGKAYTVYPLRDGLWSDPTIWSTGAVPGPTDNVYVHDPVSVSIDTDVDVANLIVGGNAKFVDSRNLIIWAGTITVLGTGHLEITSAKSVSFIFRDLPPTDPGQFSIGLTIAGKFTVAGVPRVPFVRLSTEPLAGASQLNLGQVVDWQVGDEIFLPDSRHLATNEIGPKYVPKYETRTITAVAADGKSVTLNQPLAFTHPAARDDKGAVAFLPHVANLTRNITFASENPAGNRAYLVATAAAEVQVKHAAFTGMGRTTISPIDNDVVVNGVVTKRGTNQLGRYAMHLHQMSGVPFHVKGNVIRSCKKWGVVAHGLSVGSIVGNIVLDGEGAGIAIEDAMTKNNVVSGNFVSGITGTGRKENDDTNATGWGRAGVGIWLGSAVNDVNGNVVNRCGIYGYAFHSFQNADTIRSFSQNEVYGAIESGLTIWNVGYTIANGKEKQPVPISRVDGFRAWHFWRHGYFGYPTVNVVFDSPVMVGDSTKLSNLNEQTIGLFHSDYEVRYGVVTNPSIVNLRTGIMAPSTVGDTREHSGLFPYTVVGGYLNNNVNVFVYDMASTGGCQCGNRQVTIDGVKFGSYSRPAQSPFNIAFRSPAPQTFGRRFPLRLQQMLVKDYNGVAGDNFQVYGLHQAPTAIVPQSSTAAPGTVGIPVAGLTNEQAMMQFGAANAGEISQTADRRPLIEGFIRK